MPPYVCRSPSGQPRWRENWEAIEGTSALGWGRSFLASLIRAASGNANRRPAGGASGEQTLPVNQMRSSPDLRSTDMASKEAGVSLI